MPSGVHRSFRIERIARRVGHGPSVLRPKRLQPRDRPVCRSMNTTSPLQSSRTVPLAVSLASVCTGMAPKRPCKPSWDGPRTSAVSRAARRDVCARISALARTSFPVRDCRWRTSPPAHGAWDRSAALVVDGPRCLPQRYARVAGRHMLSSLRCAKPGAADLVRPARESNRMLSRARGGGGMLRLDSIAQYAAAFPRNPSRNSLLVEYRGGILGAEAQNVERDARRRAQTANPKDSRHGSSASGARWSS